MTDDAVTQRRDEVTNRVRRWCARARVDAGVDQLSDESALLIAAGRLDSATRELLAHRRRADRRMPGIGGYWKLRQFARARMSLGARLRDSGGPLRLLLQRQYAEIEGLLRDQQARIARPEEAGRGYFERRRMRNDPLVLAPERRVAIAAALVHTPCPEDEQVLQRLTGGGVTDTVGRIGRAIEQVSTGRTREWVAQQLSAGRGEEERQGCFSDSYEALLFLAGSLYDRVQRSPAWHSQLFTDLAVELDLAYEVEQIAVDAVELRRLMVDLRSFAARGGSGVDKDVRRRTEALGAVWDALVERVAALARIGDMLTQAEEVLRSTQAITSMTTGLDHRIDSLLARTGDGTLATSRAVDIGERAAAMEPFLRSYQQEFLRDIRSLRG